MSTYNSIDEARRKRLPKFAQDYMCGLENRVRELENLQVKHEKTPVSFGRSMKTGEEGYLYPHASVRFDLGVDGMVECYRRKVGNRFVLDIHGLRCGVAVYPQASNSIYVIEERFI